MGILIDTSLLVAVDRGHVPPEAASAEEPAISVVTVSELMYGVYRAAPARRPHRRLLVDRILARFEALPITEEIARVHAELGAGLTAEGATLGVNDLWIGATALVHDLALATRDRRSFSRIPGLRVVAV